MSLGVQVGQTVHHWTILEIGHRLPFTDGQVRAGHKRGKRAALCVCDCGTQRLVNAVSLERGISTNCGCRHKKSARRDEACSVQGCTRPYAARGWCARHYNQWKLHGDPEAYPRGSNDRTPEERFLEKVIKTASCWIWTSGLTVDGYAQFDRFRAHRWSYEHFVGPIPEGLTIDHLCNNRACVNPEHLEPATHSENCRRAAQRRRNSS